MEILCSVVGKIVELTVEPVGRQLSYLCFINDNIQKLKSHVEMLKETRETVQRMVNDARKNVEDIKPSVQNWLTKVDAIIERSDLIITNEWQQIKLCFNLVQRHQLSRKAVKMANEVLEMNNNGNFDRVSYIVAKYESLLTKTSDFHHFESRRSTKEQIMDALMDDHVKKIAIYGMGGIGKTVIVKEISKEIIEKKLFEEVVILTVSQTPDLINIQEELAEKLGLKLEEKTIEGRSLKLYKRLKIERRYLIVFDDIWIPIDLEMIGIPCDEDHKGCKILFTSRDKHTLTNDMCINKIFEIQVLWKDEAWNFFKKIVGETVETIDLKPLAIQIVKECANLPIAILTVAKALRNKPTSLWKDALNQLRNPRAVNIRGMNEKVYASLKLSYEQLECEEAKMLFLLCSIFPEDFKINVQYLHMYAMAFDLLHGVDNVAQGRHRIRKLVDDLISSSLLLKYADDYVNPRYANDYAAKNYVNYHATPNYANDYVKMHDLVRDVAMLIASKDDQIRTLSYVKNSNEWEADEVSGNHTAVYLDVKGFQSPPQKLVLPKIQLLILIGRCNSLQELSINNFEEMKELKVLELQSMNISSLPPSVLYPFTNVRSLHLVNSELKNIDMIGQLKKLEILSFRKTKITQIPTNISQLTQLKVLDLSSCYFLEVIPPNVLSKLTKLEELNLETYNGWEKEELNNERKNASLAELKDLSYISTLCLRIKDEKVMPRQMFSLKLNLETFNILIGFPETFNISIGFHQILAYDRQEIIERKLYLKVESEWFMNNEIKMLVRTSEELHLEGSFGAKIFFFGLDENESYHVKYLDLLNIDGLQHIIHEKKQSFRKALSNLVHLYLSGLKDLECVIQGHDRKFSFNKLKFVIVENCNKLASLFSKSIVDDISNLEKIEIKNCEMMEVIFVMKNEEGIEKFEFTQLKILQLWRLPQLTQFCTKIEEGGTNNFGASDSFFNQEVSLPNLVQLRIEQAGNLKMICGNILFPNCFSKLREVYIDYCNNLEKVFSWTVMSVLACLESISIKNCSFLEGIFEVHEPNATKDSIVLFPQLENLELFNLPNLRYVWSERACEFLVFANMKSLSIHQCPKLKLECGIEVLLQLKRLKADLSGLEEILERERSRLHQFKTFESKLFSNLRTLKLHGCLDYNLTHLPREIVQILPYLENFEVEKAFIEEIFPNERSISVKEHECATSELFQSWYLYKLPKLKHLWKEGSQNNTSVHLQHLHTLRIRECGIMNALVSSLVSLRNLRRLHVHKCHRLTHLLNPSVARTLVQLERLEVRECKRMATIVDVGGVEEGNDEIVFIKLRSLVLPILTRLTSFHSGRCVIKFPSLNHVRIYGCPEMKLFSLGTVSTPNLKAQSIEIVNGISFWSGRKGMMVEDINYIIRECWSNCWDTNLQYLFAQENSEENQI